MVPNPKVMVPRDENKVSSIDTIENRLLDSSLPAANSAGNPLAGVVKSATKSTVAVADNNPLVTGEANSELKPSGEPPAVDSKIPLVASDLSMTSSIAAESNVSSADSLDSNLPAESPLKIQPETGRTSVDAVDARSLVVEGVLRSPALQQIQIEFLKKQLVDRDQLIEQLGKMQPQFLKQVDEFARENEKLLKREQESMVEVKRSKAELEQIGRKHEVEIQSIQSELAAMRQQYRDQASLFGDKLAEADRTRVEEVAKLTSGLNDAHKARLDSIAALRTESTESSEVSMKRDSHRISEQQAMIDSQIETISQLQKQIETIQASQSMDARRIDRLRNELKVSNDARQKASGDRLLQSVENRVSPDNATPSKLSEPTTSTEIETIGSNPKTFVPPVPDIKSIKPRIPRIEGRVPNRVNLKSF